MPDQIATGTPNVEPGDESPQTWLASNPRIRMNGAVNLTGRYFDVPLITRVELPGAHIIGLLPESADLWQGGCIPGVPLDDDFDIVYSFYPWGKYRLGADTERLEYRVYDSLDQAVDQFAGVADQIVDSLRAGKKVLVHCQAGLNRSGTACAAALIKLGMTAPDALALLRESRGTDQVVCNTTFQAWLMGLGAA